MGWPSSCCSVVWFMAKRSPNLGFVYSKTLQGFPVMNWSLRLRIRNCSKLLHIVMKNGSQKQHLELLVWPPGQRLMSCPAFFSIKGGFLCPGSQGRPQEPPAYGGYTLTAPTSETVSGAATVWPIFFLLLCAVS